jgi:hypothetical protein
MTDIINNPPHYTQGSIDVCDFILDQKLNYLEGNIVKYICRKTKDNHIPEKRHEDLLKARWYLNTLIKQEEEKKK